MSRTDTYPGALDRRPSGSWRWRVSIEGDRHTEHWSDELSDSEAERKARKRYDTMTGQKARGGATSVRLCALIKVYRDQRLPELAESSQRSYESALKALETYYEGERDPLLRSLSRGDVKAFLSWRKIHNPDGEKRGEPLSAWSI